jgi:hypothetical protein
MLADASIQESQRFSRAERLELAWALTWPASVIWVIYWLLRAPRVLSKDPTEWIIEVLCLGVLGLFLFTPWVVRRAVKLDFREFHLVALRGGSREATRGINYWESLRVAWLFTWRTVMIGLMLLVLVQVLWLGIHWLITGILPPKGLEIGTLQSVGISGFLRTLGDEMIGLLLTFWVAKAAVRKSYSNFSFRIERTDALANSRPTLASGDCQA